MRRFTELCLKPENMDELVSIGKSLGYSAVGLSKKATVDGVDIVKRLDLDPKNPNELIKSLRSSRWNNEIIAVNCRTKTVARQAGKDNRVDLITYPLSDKWKQNFLDPQQANLMRDSNCGYLIDLSLLLIDDRYVLGKRIELLKRNTTNALKKDIPVVASSFATDKWGIRDPNGLASLLSLLDIEEELALDTVSRFPDEIITRNRDKLKDTYVLPGVWVIEEN
ncbi:hypothetical protein E2P71_08385 [Candidatus Bathyarchaeota archaeon]|nr:hypothetical protein E2P71_08385 [Candidatus Bathyarchaeota archaeon]